MNGRAAVLTAVAVLMIGAAGCGSSDKDASSAPATTGAGDASTLDLPKLDGQKLQVAGVWTGAEQKNFLKVLARFDELTGASTTFVPTGDNVSTFVGSKIQGGSPPDVALLPQPGVLQQFAKEGWLKPLQPAVTKELDQNYSKAWRDLSTYESKQYGVFFKVTNKSLFWYNTAIWEQAGLSTTPTTWEQLLKDGQTLSDSGTPPFSIGGAEGWLVTDWFENIYLSQAGPAMYDKLTKHQIKWTDPSVTKALTTLGQIFGRPDLMAGGTRGTLQTDFPTSVGQVFSDPPKAALVYEGEFIATNITQETTAKVGTDAKVFPFPSVDGGKAPVVSSGDVAVALKDGEGAQALMRFLVSPEAAEIAVQQGGFLSPNKAVAFSNYRDDTVRGIAKNLIKAGDNIRFDMSDQAPAAFGGTKGQGEWKDLQDFLAKPSDVAGAQKQLEADAAKAFAKAG